MTSRLGGSSTGGNSRQNSAETTGVRIKCDVTVVLAVVVEDKDALQQVLRHHGWVALQQVEAPDKTPLEQQESEQSVMSWLGGRGASTGGSPDRTPLERQEPE